MNSFITTLRIFLGRVSAVFLFVFLIVVSIPFAVATTPSSVNSIDQCLQGRKFAYNEVFNIWVEEHSLVRCVKVDDTLIAMKGGFTGSPEEAGSEGALGSPPVTSENLCKGKSESEIITHGHIQRNVGGRTFNGRIWEEKCSALGPLPGRNHLMVADPNDFLQNVNLGVGTQGIGTPGTMTRYTGGGLGVPDDRRYDIKGISKAKDLKALAIGWTNFLLPYVSVLSVFAFVVAGLFYIVSFFSEDLNAKAKNIIVYTIIGIVLIFSAYTIVTTLLDISR